MPDHEPSLLTASLLGGNAPAERPSRRRRLPFDAADLAFVVGLLIGVASLAALWLPLGGVALAAILIGYAWRVS